MSYDMLCLKCRKKRKVVNIEMANIKEVTKMGAQSLTVHILIQNKNDLSERHSFFVYLEGARMIQRLRRIISTRSKEKAMMFALTKGRHIDPGEVNGSHHLILTRNGAYWELM